MSCDELWWWLLWFYMFGDVKRSQLWNFGVVYREKNTWEVHWHPAGALTSLFTILLHLHVPTTYQSQWKQYWGHLPCRGASAQTKAPPTCLFGLGGHCAPWISLIHPHPIVSTLRCDWPNTVRTCITLKIDGKSWQKYIKEGPLGKIHNPKRLWEKTDWTVCSLWGTKTQRKFKQTTLSLRLCFKHFSYWGSQE